MTREVTYADLPRDVQRLANALKDRGVSKGDVVGSYLPMIPEVVVAMLACARIGEQVDGMEGGIGLQVQLVAVDPPYPGRCTASLRANAAHVWFTAGWMFASQKDGVSALSLQRSLEIGSYPTAWAMLHRLRSVLVRPGRTG